MQCWPQAVVPFRAAKFGVAGGSGPLALSVLGGIQRHGRIYGYVVPSKVRLLNLMGASIILVATFSNDMRRGCLNC